MKEKNSIIRFRIFFILILAILIIVLLYTGIAPAGQAVYFIDFSKGSRSNYFVNKLTPPDRVSASSAGLTLIGEPVYFNLNTLRRFSQATLTIKYKNPQARPLIEAGVLADKIVWRYDLQPIENLTIDRLAVTWPMLEDNGTILLQQEKKYASIRDFLVKLPPRAEIALYNYDLENEYILPGYATSSEKANITAPLRGAYQFYTYVGDEKLEFKFDFLDLNQNRDADPVIIDLYYRGKLIGSRSLADDGDSTDDGFIAGPRSLTLSADNLPAGAYKIEVKANTDIITKEIASAQSMISFINKLWIADRGSDKAGDITLFTNSSSLSAETDDPAKLQTLAVGKENLKLEETYHLYSMKLSGTSTGVIMKKDNVILAGNKNFAFSADALFDPEFAKVGADFDPVKSGIKYILADYRIPAVENGWRVAQASFDLRNAYREIKPHLIGEPSRYSFMLSIPGLVSSDNKNDYIEIKEIKIKLEGTGLWKKIIKKF